MTVARAGVISAGGPAIRIDGESTRSGSSPSRRHFHHAQPSVPSRASGAPISPSAALICRDRSSSARTSGRGRIGDGPDGLDDRLFSLSAHRERDEGVVDDRLELLLVGVRVDEPGAAEEAHAALARIGIEPDHQHDAVVEARAADAPLVDERSRVLEVLVLADVRDVLRVDDHLGAGLGLHVVDQGLDLRDRRGAEHASRVVDGLVLHRIGKGWPGGQRQQRRQGEERERARERASPSMHRMQHTGWHSACFNADVNRRRSAHARTTVPHAATPATSHGWCATLPGDPHVKIRTGAAVALIVAALAAIVATAGVAAVSVRAPAVKPEAPILGPAPRVEDLPPDRGGVTVRGEVLSGTPRDARSGRRRDRQQLCRHVRLDGTGDGGAAR